MAAIAFPQISGLLTFTGRESLGAPPVEPNETPTEKIDRQKKEFALLKQVTFPSPLRMRPYHRLDRVSIIRPYDSHLVSVAARHPGHLTDTEYAPIGSSIYEGRYIVTQAPVPEEPTLPLFVHFMRLLNQHQVPLILCLTSFVENNRKKADPYLPYEEGEIWDFHTLLYPQPQKTFDWSKLSPSIHHAPFDNYTITCMKTHPLIPLTADWHLEQRDFELQFPETVAHRTHELSVPAHRFTQMFLPTWKDGSAATLSQILALVKKVYTYIHTNNISGPILVHCKAGVGRSGQFINSYEIYSKLRASPLVHIDPFEIAYSTGIQRCRLGLHNLPQYAALEEFIEFAKNDILLDGKPSQLA